MVVAVESREMTDQLRRPPHADQPSTTNVQRRLEAKNSQSAVVLNEVDSSRDTMHGSYARERTRA